jgi:excisionase family DNA binding protein
MDYVQSAYTTKEAARLLSCHSETLRRAIRNGELKAQKGRPYRISVPELKRWWRATGGGEIRCPIDDADPKDLSRIENPVGVDSAVDMARRVTDALGTLSSLCRHLDLDASPVQEAEKHLQTFRKTLEE